MRARLALLCLAMVATPIPGAAQWTIDLTLGLVRFGGTSSDTSGRTVNGSFRPYVPTLLGAALSRRIDRVTLGVRLSFASAAVALKTDEGTVVDPATLLHVGVAPEVGWAVARMGSGGATLHLHAGPLMELWALEGENARWRLGVQTGASLDCPLGRRFASATAVRVGVSPSIWKAGELPAEFVRRASWRTTVAFGLRYRL